MEHEHKKEIKAAICRAMTGFLTEKMGERTFGISTEVAGDTIIVRLKGIMSPAERILAKKQEGMKLVKEFKEKLIEKAKPYLEEMIKNIVGAEVIDIYSSFDPVRAESIEVFVLNRDLSDCPGSPKGKNNGN